jgi:5'-3' exonuclease
VNGPRTADDDRPCLLLLDGTLLFFRALYGVPDRFQDGAGRSINGVRGYLAGLLRLLESRPASFCAAAFDESLNSCWRNRVFPDYKANRPPPDDNVLHQLALCREVTELLNIPVLADLEWEADDYIATLARHADTEDIDVVIVSRDKDLRQLLRPRVQLLDPGGDSSTGAVEFEAEFGFPPDCFPDFQALTGDKVDNVPGIRGIGPKTAQSLVARFGPLESVFASVSEWPEAGIKAGSKAAANLLEGRDDAFLFRRVLRLSDDVPDLPPLPAFALEPPARESFEKGLEGLGLTGRLGSAVDRFLGNLND